MKPTVNLIGVDGNAYHIIGLCTKAARKAKWNKEQILSFQREMMSGDYNNVLQTAMKYFDVK